MDPKGKVALITGGAGGIGKAVALRLLQGGAKVVLWDLFPAALEAAVKELSVAGEVRGHAVDITDRRAVAEAAEKVRAEVGDVDILDNNAGVVFGGNLLDCPEEKLFKTIDVNVNAVMWCTRAFLPGMIRKGTGHLVMMASASGLLGVPGLASYSASKHAVIGLSESLRLELRKAGHRGIGMTIACPSFVASGMFEGVKPPLLTPWLTTDGVADKVYKAIVKNRLYIRAPFMIKMAPFLKGLCIPALVDLLGDLLGMHSAMDHFHDKK